MRRNFAMAAGAVVLAMAVTAYAQDHRLHMDHQQHMPGVAASDARQLVDFPPEMRQHTLANMRDHLQALSEILVAMASAKYADAARVASTRLGMNSPSAEGCRNDNASSQPAMSRPGNMDHQMAQFMPEAMRNIGLEMHKAASVFADEAGKANKTGNARPALAALSRVTQQCAACHAAYKVQG